MLARVKTSRRGSALAGALTVIALTLGMAGDLKAADCPPLRQPNVPKSEEPVLNIDKHKRQLRAYLELVARETNVSIARLNVQQHRDLLAADGVAFDGALLTCGVFLIEKFSPGEDLHGDIT
jgi:hypothetical protein